MARVTVEDCLARIPNRFALTILGSRRARALSEGRGHALVDCDNKEGVTALREISGARVRFKEDVEAALIDFIAEQRRQLRVTTGEHTFLEAASLRALEDEDDESETEDEADVEELQSDPEALGKQAKGDGDTDADDEEEVTDDEVPEEEETADEEEIETPFGEDEIPDDSDAEVEDDDDDKDKKSDDED